VIGQLRGKLLAKQAPHLLVDVHGVCYEVEAPMSTFYQLPETGVEIILHTHLAVRDDAHLLYGFASEPERRLFRSLIKVNGVGARLALGILSGMDASTFARLVFEGDSAALTRLPGVGKKTAERLVVEMRDRLDNLSMPAMTGGVTGAASAGAAADPVADAVSALVALGYRPQDASRQVHAVESEGMNSEEIIRRALQEMVTPG